MSTAAHGAVGAGGRGEADPRPTREAGWAMVAAISTRNIVGWRSQVRGKECYHSDFLYSVCFSAQGPCTQNMIIPGFLHSGADTHLNLSELEEYMNTWIQEYMISAKSFKGIISKFYALLVYSDSSVYDSLKPLWERDLGVSFSSEVQQTGLKSVMAFFQNVLQFLYMNKISYFSQDLHYTYSSSSTLEIDRIKKGQREM